MGAISFSIDEKLLAMLVAELPLKAFVETGTFRGDSLKVAHRFFSESHSVELSPEYYAAAVKTFSGQSGIHLHQGESPAFLRAQRERLVTIPTLFWLDAHWCVADNTAGADSQSPLLAEIQAIGALNSQSVVLIDDARLYLCAPPAPHRVADWPDFHAIVKALLALGSGHRLMVLNDVILLYPEEIRGTLAAFAHRNGVDWLDTANQSKEFLKRRQRKRRGLLQRLGLRKPKT